MARNLILSENMAIASTLDDWAIPAISAAMNDRDADRLIRAGDSLGIPAETIVAPHGREIGTSLMLALLDSENGAQRNHVGKMSPILHRAHAREILESQFMTQAIQLPAIPAWTPQRKAERKNQKHCPWGKLLFHFPPGQRTQARVRRSLERAANHGITLPLDGQVAIPLSCALVGALVREQARIGDVPEHWQSAEWARNPIKEWTRSRSARIDWKATDSLGGNAAMYLTASLIKEFERAAKNIHRLPAAAILRNTLELLEVSQLSLDDFRKPNVFGQSARDLLLQSQIPGLEKIAMEIGENLAAQPPKPPKIAGSAQKPGSHYACGWWTGMPTEAEMAIEQLREILDHGAGEAALVYGTLKRCKDAGLELSGAQIADPEHPRLLMSWLLHHQAHASFRRRSGPPDPHPRMNGDDATQSARVTATQLARVFPDVLTRDMPGAAWFTTDFNGIRRPIKTHPAFLPWLNRIYHTNAMTGRCNPDAMELCQLAGNWPDPNLLDANGNNFPAIALSVPIRKDNTYFGVREIRRNYQPADLMTRNREGICALDLARNLLQESQTPGEIMDSGKHQANAELAELIDWCFSFLVKHGQAGPQGNSDAIAGSENGKMGGTARLRQGKNP